MAPLKMGAREVRQTRGAAALAALLLAACLVVLAAGSQAALPPNNTVFELDRNAAPASNGAQPRADDWNDVYAQITADGNDEGNDDKCIALGAVECAFAADPLNASIFIGGNTKDHIDIPSWLHTTGSVPDKDEITNAYAAKYIVNNEQILYFGADRFAQNGSADFGFWFFRNPVAPITSGPNAGTWSGQHSIGDILILGTFTQGGATATARVFRWVGSGGNEGSGTISGPDATFADCNPGNLTQNGCSTVNNGLIPVGWTYLSKGGDTQIPSGGFVEGGINLTAIGLGGCFSSFIAETRSSPSITAVLKDFVSGNFEVCESALTTTPANGAGTLLTDSDDEDTLREISIGTGSATVRDSAALNISGVASWSGTLDFWLCKLDTGLCDGTTNVGTKIGTTINVTQASTQPVLSATTTVTSAGRYCWRAVFTPTTQGVPASTDARESECFEVLPVTPTITTNATSVVVGLSPISDSATLSGTATQPGNPIIGGAAGSPAGGTITFRAYGPNDATCAGTPAFTSSPVAVSGNGTYGPVSFTPTALGTYRWVASYSGNTPNTNAANGACNDANETSQVVDANISITPRSSPPAA